MGSRGYLSRHPCWSSMDAFVRVPSYVNPGIVSQCSELVHETWAVQRQVIDKISIQYQIVTGSPQGPCATVAAAEFLFFASSLESWAKCGGVRL
jgi:hypothetical protein